MHTLFLDESGKPTSNRDKNGNLILENSRYFTLGGISVDEKAKGEFYEVYEKIMTEYLGGIDLKTNFKLHYNELRMLKEPYDKITKSQRFKLENDVFEAIKKIDCTLFSVTIDLEYHYNHYSNPIFPMALALWYILERFQYYVSNIDGKGIAVYEQFTESLRNKVNKEWKKLESYEKFPQPTDFKNLKKKVLNGDPTKEPMLAFADFFVYLPWNRKMSNSKWKGFGHKYHALDSGNRASGNVEIE